MNQEFSSEVCNYIYDHEVGDPEGGISPGSPFEEIPEIGFAQFATQRKANSNPCQTQHHEPDL